MKIFLVSFFCFCFFLFMQSCSQPPFACFETDVNEDSIHVNQQVTFNTACSINADEYYWTFSDNEDSVFYTNIVKRKFNDTGDVSVFLLVTKGRKTSSITKDVHINP